MTEYPLGRPGSDEAIENGCLCPVLDNGHGNPELEARGYWQHVECRLPGHVASTMILQEEPA